MDLKLFVAELIAGCAVLLAVLLLSADVADCAELNWLGLACSGVVLQVVFQPKQLMLVTSGDDADLRVWDLVSKSCVAVLKVHSCTHCRPQQHTSLACGQQAKQVSKMAQVY